MPYPSTISTFTNPAPSERLNSPSHSSIETAQNTGLTEIQTFTGTLSSAVGTLVYDIRAAASDGGGHVQTARRGGTGQTAYSQGDILVGQSSSVLSRLAVGGAGQALIVNATTATGVGWGSIAGIPPSILTMVPRPPMATTFGERGFTNQSVAVAWQFPINFPIRASIITVLSGNAITTSGTLDFTIYNEQGSASILTLVTPTISAVYTLYQGYVSPVVTINPGNYYALTNTNAATNFNMVTWDSATSVVGRLGNLADRPVLQGTYVIAGGSPPASIVTTAITSVTGQPLESLYFRIDG